MKKALLIGVAALLLAGCSSQTTTTASPTPTLGVVEDTTPVDTTGMEAEPTGEAMESESTMVSPLTIDLGEQNDSGQSGTAVLEDKGGKLVVTLTMTGTASTVAQPAHIHVGSCPTPGAVKFPLTDVKAGKSVTTLDTTLAALQDMQPLAINVHKSAAESKVYTSCGDVK